MLGAFSLVIWKSGSLASEFLVLILGSSWISASGNNLASRIGSYYISVITTFFSTLCEHYTKHCMCVRSFNPQEYAARKALCYPYFTDGKTEARGG